MRNWPLVKRILKEQEKHISPWRRVFLDLVGATFGKLVITFGLFILGILLSAETGDWMWFSRFGCLIAVVGIFVVITNVEQAVAGKSRVHQSGEDTGAAAEQEARDIVAIARGSDLGILVFGNLIWGFGDLIGRL